MPSAKKTIILAGEKGKKGVKTILVECGELGNLRSRYNAEMQELGKKYAWIEMHNLSRISRRANASEEQAR